MKVKPITLPENIGDRLAVVGKALYGQRWVKPLSEDLGVARNTIYTWIAGEFSPSKGPEYVDGELLRIVEARAEEFRMDVMRVTAMADALRKRAGK